MIESVYTEIAKKIYSNYESSARVNVSRGKMQNMYAFK